jgi:protein associated with RNAse G/E
VQLVDKGLIDNESNMQDPNEMLNLLQISELKQICKQMNFPPSISSQPKHQCISSMLAYCRQHKSFLSKVTPLDALIKLLVHPHVNVMLY